MQTKYTKKKSNLDFVLIIKIRLVSYQKNSLQNIFYNAEYIGQSGRNIKTRIEE